MSNIAKHDPEPFIIDPEPTPLGQAAAIICGHPVIQAFDAERLWAFHGFVQEVLATTVEPELERKDREIARMRSGLDAQLRDLENTEQRGRIRELEAEAKLR